jgi:hypothetical protein
VMLEGLTEKEVPAGRNVGLSLAEQGGGDGEQSQEN